MTFKSLIGTTHSSKKCGKYTVLEYLGNRYFKVFFLNTGTTKVVQYNHIVAGNVRDPLARTVCGVGFLDGISVRHKLYQIWSGMLKRCYSQKCPAYPRYGGKGVRVCDKWHSLKNFVQDAIALPGWEEKMRDWAAYSIDKDILGGNLYSPETCCWVTRKEQAQNTTNTFLFYALSPKGEIFSSKSQADFAEEHSLVRCKISACLGGLRKSHMGWKFSREPFEEIKHG